MLKKRNRAITLLLFALCVMITSNISQFYFGNYNGNSNRNQTTDPISDTDVINDLKVAANEPNGKPLLIHQHSTISNSFFPSSLPTNVSFTLLEGWTSKNVTINYDGVSHQKDWVVNGTFDSGESPWEYFANNSDFLQKPWNPIVGEDCVGIEISKGVSFSKGDYGYFEENFTIPEPSASNTFAQLSIDYHFIHTQGISSNNISLFISIDIGGEKINTTAKLIDLVEDYWTEMSVSYDLTNFNQLIIGNNDNITLRVGVITENNTITDSSKAQYIYLDNIQFIVWTEPNVSNLIIAKDLDDNEEYDYQNTDFGKGEIFIDGERSKTGTSDIKFTISKNDTFTEELKVYNITISSEAVKIFNSTIDLHAGSLYTSSTNIEWQIECLFDFLPFTYINNWVEIKKPSDWNITSVSDGYTVEKRASCTGYQLGSENLQIPKGVFAPGLWKIKAVSQNYLSKGSLIVWNGTTYNEESRVTWGDTFQINVTLNNTVTYVNTNLSCTIEHSNGTLYWQSNKELSSYNLKFGNFSVGSNMSVGDYQVIVEWTNNNTYLSRDQVGFAEFGFKVWHRTNLTAVDSDFERIAGGPLLIKVKFFDIDINMAVQFASVKYNSTFGASGVMIYLGSGVYFIDIDTSSLSLGVYYFSFNSTLEFYENQTAIDLIHLKIIAQPLALEGPSSAINAMANNYAICQINVTGATSGALLSGNANMTTDWDNPYQITNDSLGTFTLNFSTFGIPTQGVLESFTITIFANKTNYGTTTGFITLIVNPIHTIADANKTVINAYLNETVYLKVNYTIEGSNELISGANCSVEWQGLSNIVSVDDEFIISLDTSGLSINDYTALMTLEHVGYTTAFRSVTIIVNPIQTNADANRSAVYAYLNEIIYLKVNYTIEGSNELISGANCSVDWEGESNIVSVDDEFIISLDTSGLSINDYTVLMTLEHAGYTTAFKSVTVTISNQNVNLTVAIDFLEVNENSLIPFYFNEVITLSCRASAMLEQIYLSGGTITFISTQFEQKFMKYNNSWFNTSIQISASNFSLGINYVYIEFQQDNYTTTTFSFQILVNQIEIDVQTIDFQDSIEANTGEKIIIRINLTESETLDFIEEANISYYWDFGQGYFEEIGDGIYELEIVVPENIGGNYKITLIIQKEGAVYKTQESSFILAIKEPDYSVFIVWIIIIISGAIISILGMLSLRSYVILPRRREREAELINNIQVFKDVWNIRAVILIHRESGLPIYSEEISFGQKDQDSTLISGFVQAITAFGESFIEKEFKPSKKLTTDYDYMKTIIDLDFKFFQLLICDVETIRVLLILRGEASDQLKGQLYLLAVAINSRFSEDLKKFTGTVSHLKIELQDLLNQFILLHYNKEFEITPNKSYYNSILESEDLTNLERRIVNVVASMTKLNKTFILKETINLIEENNEDLVLEALNSLIQRKLIVSPYYPKLKQKK